MPIQLRRVRTPADGDCAFHVWSKFMETVLGTREVPVGELRTLAAHVLTSNAATLQQLLCDGAEQWEHTVHAVATRGEYVESSLFAVVAFALFKMCAGRCPVVHVHVDYDQHEMPPEVYTFPPRAGSVHDECGWSAAVWPDAAVLPRVATDVLDAVARGGELCMYVRHQAEPVLHFDLLLAHDVEQHAWACAAAEWVVVEDAPRGEEEKEEEGVEGEGKSEVVVQGRQQREARMRQYMHDRGQSHATASNTSRGSSRGNSVSSSTTTSTTSTTTSSDTLDIDIDAQCAQLQHTIQQQRAQARQVERALAVELLAAQVEKHRATLARVEHVLCEHLAAHTISLST